MTGLRAFCRALLDLADALVDHYADALDWWLAAQHSPADTVPCPAALCAPRMTGELCPTCRPRTLWPCRPYLAVDKRRQVRYARKRETARRRAGAVRAGSEQ